jgi:hypothetical protein
MSAAAPTASPATTGVESEVLRLRALMEKGRFAEALAGSTNFTKRGAPCIVIFHDGRVTTYQG